MSLSSDTSRSSLSSDATGFGPGMAIRLLTCRFRPTRPDFRFRPMRPLAFDTPIFVFLVRSSSADLSILVRTPSFFGSILFRLSRPPICPSCDLRRSILVRAAQKLVSKKATMFYESSPSTNAARKFIEVTVQPRNAALLTSSGACSAPRLAFIRGVFFAVPILSRGQLFTRGTSITSRGRGSPGGSSS